MLEEYKDILTVKELCEILKIGKNSAYKLLKNNDVKSTIICNAYKIPKKYLIDFIMNHTKIGA